MTPIQKELRRHREELNLENFGEIMDEFLTKNECQMLITIPEGSSEVNVIDNMGIGSLGAFYFLLKALTPTLNKLLNCFEKKDLQFDRGKLVTQLLEMVKAELLEE